MNNFDGTVIFENPERMCFAVCKNGVVVPIGDHGDHEAAKATADDLGLEYTKLYFGAGNDE